MQGRTKTIKTTRPPAEPIELGEPTQETWSGVVTEGAQKAIVSRFLKEHSGAMICFECGEILFEDELFDLKNHVYLGHDMRIEEYLEKHGPVEIGYS